MIVLKTRTPIIPLLLMAVCGYLPSQHRCVAEEVQAHGVSFEEWVRDTFFDGYEGEYTQKWDISAEANQCAAAPKQGIPISVKLVKYKSPIGMGDFIRQHQLNHEFLMIVGFWLQKTETEKHIVEVACLHIRPEGWRQLWGGLRLQQLEELDALVKDMDTHYKDARVQAQLWKKEVLPETECQIVVNPKIDSRGQRRVQCSMPFKLFWQIAGREPDPESPPVLFGETFPNPIYSKPRSFNK